MVDPSDIRYLTDEELLTIINGIPPIRSKIGRIGDVVTNSMRIHLEKLLRKGKSYPGAIGFLTRRLKERSDFGAIDPGIPVGINASTAAGEPVTQMTLNSKRSSGTKKTVTESFNRILELVNVSVPKYKSTNLCLRNKFPTLDDVIDFRIKYVELLFSDIVVDYDIVRTDSYVLPNWAYTYISLLKIELPENSKNLLILTLDVIKLVKNRVRMSDLSKTIYDNSKITCVCSPLCDGTMILFPDENVAAQDVVETLHGSGITIDIDKISSLYFINAVVPSFNKIKIKGITGIKEVLPSSIPYMFFFEDEYELSNGKWRIIVNPVKMNMYNLSEESFTYVFESAGFKIDSVFEETYLSGKLEYAQAPLIFDLDTTYVRPSSILHKSLQNEKRLENGTWDVGENSELFLKIGNAIVSENNVDFSKIPPKLLLEVILEENAKYMFIEINGINTTELVILPEVDPYHLYTNDISDTYRTLGIEATRCLFINEFLQVTATSGIYVNPKHIHLLADMMTNLGYVNKLTITGMISKKTGPLDTATFERASVILSNAAAFNVSQGTKTVSTSILLGKIAEIGSGLSDVQMDRSRYEAFIKELKEKREAPGPIKDVDIRKALDLLKEQLLEPIHVEYIPLDEIPGIEKLISFKGSVPSSKKTIEREESQFKTGETASAISTDRQFRAGSRRRFKLRTYEEIPPQSEHPPMDVGETPDEISSLESVPVPTSIPSREIPTVKKSPIVHRG